METTAGTQEQTSAAPPERFPLLTGVIVFRLGLVLYSIGLVLAVMHWVQPSAADSSALERLATALRGLLLLGMPSLIISIGLLLRQRWMGWAVVAFDCVWVAFSMGGGLTRYVLDDRIGSVLLGAMLFGGFFCEGLSVLRRLCGTRRAWIAFAVVSAVAFCFGVRWFLAPRIAAINRVRPVIDYADATWFKMPRDLIRFEIKTAKDPKTGYTAIMLDRKGGDARVGACDTRKIRFLVKDLGEGRWLIPGDARRGENIVAVATVPGQLELFDRPEISGFRMTPARQALSLIESIVGKKGQLTYVGPVDKMSIVEEDDFRGEKRVVRCEYSQGLHAVRSQSQRTLYYTSTEGAYLWVRPERDVVVPER